MVRETRHLWVGNLPENIREDRIREHFKRYGPVQNVKLLPRPSAEETKGGEVTMACTVAFMDIKSAAKAHNASDLKIDERTLNTEYYEPAAILPSNTKPNAAAGTVNNKVTPAGSPAGNTSPYSTTSFPNGHGTDIEHSPFTTGGTTTAPPPSRLPPPPEQVSGSNSTSTGPAYQDSGSNSSSGSRGRNRENNRSYRATNGPTTLGNNGNRTPSSTTGVGWTGFESSRYNNTSSAGNQSETGYNSDCPLERRNSDSQASTNVSGARKKTSSKSRSGSRSPSPSGSTSSRSHSRSRSRSSSSSGSSSTSHDTSSTSSPRQRRHRSKNHHDAAQTDDKRPLAICVRNLPLRSSDTSLKDGLFHEYKKHGKVTWVKVAGSGSDRFAIVCFKKPEDAEKALEVSYDKLFFGSKIEVEPYVICDVDESELRPYESEIDEYHPKATRTLFIGNLEKDVTASDLRKHFDQFGEIIEIDIKKQGAVSNSYAFCQYSDIASVVKAIRKMDGEHLGNNRIKLGFGKSMAYNCVWVDGISDTVTEKYLRMQFEPFGVILRCLIDREKGQALIMYEHVAQAQLAVSKMRGFMLKNAKLQVDFASRECTECFLERLEKQGHILDRGFFEDRRDSSSRSFESATSTRIRPRTSSYSSRSSVAAIQSPGTPGSMTPRGGRTRVPREYYYDVEYMATIPTERHMSHRSYDEYSQGSAASHEDPYDLYDQHGAYILHDSPGHLDPLEYEFSHHQVRVIPDLVDGVPYPPQEIRHLQKERVHLLEQLQDCPSSGDELISPKKRLKLDLLDPAITSDVIIEANRDHRKVMEVRRLSETSLRHHSRRPSIDAKYKDHMSSHYSPHTVGCKRRKTSDTGSARVPLQHSHYVTTVVEHSDGSEAGGSRPGTPLCDEKPEFPQSEPRRVPRDRDGPLTLPLPKWAQSVPPRGSVSVAGIKGQKETVNILASPPPTSSSPRVSTNTRPTTPVQHVPPPASPPPRPPSLISNSSDSDAPSPDPSLEERIKSLDEKYEKWSGSRALSAAGGEALKAEGCIEKFRQRHKLLDLDLKEVQPSEIVKSVMAKRSVFDEDLKRLECVGEKYEPKEFGLFSSSSSSRVSTVTATLSVAAAAVSSPTTVPVNNPVLVVPQPLKLSTVAAQLPKTPTMLSPTSRATSGTSIPAVKGLQYPFPSHPPIQMSPVPTLQPALQQAIVTTVNTPATQIAVGQTQLGGQPVAPTASSTINVVARIATLGENRLKPCASNPGDTRTISSKVTVNSRACTTQPQQLKTNVSIPNASDFSAAAATIPSTCGKSKSGDKVAAKISNRRDSNSNSPRADVKTRRNSDTNARKIDELEKYTDISEKTKTEEQKLAEKSKEEYDRLERENQEKERIEKERVEKEKQEKERLERERLEKKEREERESELERQRLEKERLEKERLQKEKEKQEKEERERKRKLEKERQEKVRLEKEKAEKERIEKEKIEKEKIEKERIEKEKQEREILELERRKEQEELERKERDEKDRKEKERQELEEKEIKEKEEKERKDAERNEKEEREKLVKDQEKVEKEKKREVEKEKNKHKEDNHHDKRAEESHHKHRENHSDRSTKDLSKDDKNSSKESHHEIHRRDSHHENSRHDKTKVHSEDKRRDNIKENKDNNIHDKHKILTETKEHSRDRAAVESRHLSIDLDKSKPCDSTKDSSRRKERNNSLPAIGTKRRMSSHEMLETVDEKRVKFTQENKSEKSEYKKISERRESRDSSKSDEKSKKSKHKNNSINSHESSKSSMKDEKKNDEEKRKEKEREERHKKQKERIKSKSNKNKEKEPKEIREHRDSKDSRESKDSGEFKDMKESNDFKESKDLRESKELKEPKDFRDSKDFRELNESKEYKDSRESQDSKESKDFRESRDLGDSKESGESKEYKESRDAKESGESLSAQLDNPTDKDSYLAEFNLRPKDKIDEENEQHKEKDKQKKELAIELKKDEDKHKKELHKEYSKSSDEGKSKNPDKRKHQRIRKANMSDSDSEETIRKQHSIFDVVDDNPPYISMYDKVKARSCKNMQKLEEEKQQEKIKAKFSQLKMSRARREEKKRSTSWDEDSDSDNGETKSRRRKKRIDSSDDSMDRKSTKKQDNYSDSDSSIFRQPKSETNETTDDDVKYNKHSFKFSKSRIASDTSEDDYTAKTKLNNQIISEDFHDTKLNSDNSKLFLKSEPDQSFVDAEVKLEKATEIKEELEKEKSTSIKQELEKEKTTSIKQELERLIKKERRNSKFQEYNALESQISTESYSPLSDVKEKYNSSRLFENTSDDDNEVKKDKSEKREKKHKKKQKKQKHFLIDEVRIKDEPDLVQTDTQEKSKHHEKKKDHSKKDKKRDKTKEGRDKSKKSRKLKIDNQLESRTEGKMENIFGSLSEDSDSTTKPNVEVKIEPTCFGSDDNAQAPPTLTDSEKEPDIKKERDREQEREEHKKRKEKRRREKERRLQEAAAEKAAAAAEEPPGSNENSMDFIDMGKQLEANMLKDDSQSPKAEEPIPEIDSSVIASTESFIHNEKTSESRRDKEEKREGKEKKKKRKKSKEERSKHHQHHHHDKNKAKSPEIRKDIINPIETDVSKEKPGECKSLSQSLPALQLLSQSPVEKLSPVSDFIVSPATRETVAIISPIPKTPTTSKERKREKLLPGFGGEIDEVIHENAIKSISAELKEPEKKSEEPLIKEVAKEEEKPPVVEDKPRVVISQEETEDAVAALLGESFGSNNFDNSYTDEISTSVAEETEPNLVEENTLDDEECRQAVQSLNAVADLDTKPDTPQSENDLQIDTDTEEQDEGTVPAEPIPATPEKIDFSRPPKTPDTQLFTPSPAGRTPVAGIYRTPINLGSPPSLTPIKQSSLPESVKKNLNLEEASKGLPSLSESPQKSVISDTWSNERKPEVLKPSSVSTIIETKPLPGVPQIPTTGPLLIKTYPATPVKINEPNYPPLAAISKLSPHIEQKIQALPLQSQTCTKSPTISQLHNLPARSPVQICKPVPDGMLSPKSPNMHLTRMPITSVMVTKPMQTTTVINLPQPKIAQSLEPPKLVSASDPRPPEQRPRMIFQTAGIPPYTQFAPGQPPRMIMQGNIRHLPPTGLLVPSRHLTPAGYTTYVGNIPHSVYNSVPISREGQAPMPTPSGLATSPVKQTLIVSRPPMPVTSATRQPHVPSSVVHKLPMSSSFLPQHSQQLMSVGSPINLRPPVTQSTSQSTFTNPAPQMLSPKLVPVISEPKPVLSPRLPVPVQVGNKLPETIKVEKHIVSVPLPTLIPSPVIVANPISETAKASVSEVSKISTPDIPKVEMPMIKPKVEPPKTLEMPNKSAIEKVTEELNMSLKKEVEELKPIQTVELKVEEKPVEVKDEQKLVEKEDPKYVKLAEEIVCKAEDKLETQKLIEILKDNTSEHVKHPPIETVATPVPKESLVCSDELKDDPLDTKEDSDYWSAKEVNIDSVIKTLCSADEMSDHEPGKEKETKEPKLNTSRKNKLEESPKGPRETSTENTESSNNESLEVAASKPESTPTRGGTRGRGRGGSRGRGGKSKPVVEGEGIQTRRGRLKQLTTTLLTPTKRGGRGARGSRSERIATKSESQSSDVYEFNDEEDSKQKERPRLVLTIKSTNPSTSNSQPTAIVKEITKDGAKEIGKEILSPKETTKETIIAAKPTVADHKEDFTSPQSATNTRKSRRLAEKDISKNTVDDTIEDVIKNSPQTRSAAKKTAGKGLLNKTLSMPSPETPRKSTRGRKPRRASEAMENSSSEESKDKDERSKSLDPPSPMPPSPNFKDVKEKEPEKVKEIQKEKETPKPTLPLSELPKEKPFEGLKAAMLRRIKGELTAAKAEPTNLIDPVTGLIIPMREAEEGKYIPLPGSQGPPTTGATDQTKPAGEKNVAQAEITTSTAEVISPKTAEAPDSVVEKPPVISNAGVIAQPITVVQQQPPKTHPLKAHVLSSQATKAVVSPAPVPAKLAPVQAKPPPTTTNVVQQPTVTQHQPTPVVLSKPITPMVSAKVANPVSVSQALQIVTTTVSVPPASSPMSPRPGMSVAGAQPTKVQVKLPTLSPQQQIILNQQKQFIQTQAGKPLPSNIQVTKAHVNSPLTVQQAQIFNNQMTHLKHQPQPTAIKQPGGPVVITKAPIVRPPHSLLQQQVLAGQVPSLPTKSQAAMGPNARIVQLPPGATTKGVMEPPKIDVNLPNVMLGRPSLSPQGQQARLAGLPGYEASLGEGLMHFPPGPLRPPPDHYMHPTTLMQYQHLLRQQMQQQHLQRAAGLDKTGEEGEEAPVGLAISGRVAAVPHSLHSPHDRATESPQMGQVYNTLPHTARLTPYSRYYDQAVAEPPPAHRPLTSHSSLAALPTDRGLTERRLGEERGISDRGLAHMAPLGNPDRPLSAHLQPDRPLSGHSIASAPHMGGMSATERMAAHIEQRPGMDRSGHIDRAGYVDLPMGTPTMTSSMGAGLGAAGNLLGAVAKHLGGDAPASQRGVQAATPPHASQVPPQAESLLMLLKQYPLMWQGLLALKNDQAAVQMYFVSGNDDVAKCSLPKNTDGSTPPLRIFQRMRLEPPQVEGVARKMQMENEHCMLLALPCGKDHMDVLKQSNNLTSGFITYLQQKQAAGIVNVAAPGTTQPPAYVVHIFPSCDFVNENLRRIAPSLLERVADIAHLLIVITTV